MAKTLVRRLSKSAKEALKKHSLEFSKTHITKMRELMRIGVSFRKAHLLALEKALSGRGRSEQQK